MILGGWVLTATIILICEGMTYFVRIFNGESRFDSVPARRPPLKKM